MDINLTLIGQIGRDDRLRLVLHEVHLAARSWARSTSAARKSPTASPRREKGQKDLADAHKGADGILTDARQRAVQVGRTSRTQRSSDMVGEAKNLATSEGARLIAQARAEAVERADRARDKLRKAGRRASRLRAPPRCSDARSTPRRSGELLDQLAAQARAAGPKPWLNAPPSHDPTRRRSSPTRKASKDLAGWSTAPGRAAVVGRGPAHARLIGNPHVTGERSSSSSWAGLGQGLDEQRAQFVSAAGGKPPARIPPRDRGAVRADEGRGRERGGRRGDRGHADRRRRPGEAATRRSQKKLGREVRLHTQVDADAARRRRRQAPATS